MNTPLVSIITITLNRADLIGRCIESIQKQTYSNYEHIIVDGNSQDNTEEVVKSYDDPHIKYIRLDERGPEVQMKAGSSIAMGKYVTFLDDDDEYLPTKIQKQVDFAESQPEDVGLTYCWMTIIDSMTGEVIKEHKPSYRGNCADITAAYGCISGTPTLFVKKEIFDMTGGTYDDSIGFIGSDLELTTRICQITKVDFLPESLVKVYENHSHARLSTDSSQDRITRVIRFEEHFLNRFSSVFEKNPDLADMRYFNLCRAYFKLHEYRKGFEYYGKLIRISLRPKYVVKPLIGIILNR